MKVLQNSSTQTCAVLPVPGDPRWDLVQRVMASATFSNSTRLSTFLLCVCEMALTGRADEVNEQHIGMHVFGRTPGYNSSEDSIVRSQARLLRAKLDAYFQSEGKGEGTRIIIPKGSYVPRFELNTASLPPAVVPELTPVQTAPEKRTRYAYTLLAAALLVVSAIVVFAVRFGDARNQNPLTHLFWTQVFDAAHATLIVPCDTGLVLIESEMHMQVDLASYLNRSYLSHKGFSVSSAHRYTGMPDVILSSQMFRLTESNPDRTFIRYARDLQMADLRGANLVIIGARRANPWVELFDKNNNFQGLFSNELADYVLNRKPGRGESNTYAQASIHGSETGYALISLVPGITGDENVLLVGGTTTPGTEGAANFLFSKAFEDFLNKAVDAGHKRIRHFEVLLKVISTAGSAQRPEVAAYRIRPD
jgi:hypothetical protein